MVADGSQRVDIWVRNEGVVHWCDVTVSEPACPSFVERAAGEAGVAVRAAESRKKSKWKDLAAEAGAQVDPAVHDNGEDECSPDAGGSERGETLASAAERQGSVCVIMS